VRRYSVEGSTVLGWTITVDAPEPGAAIEEARRIARGIDPAVGPVRVNAVDHRVLRCDDSPEAGPPLFVEIW
jgi:hypothetical protein